MMKSFLKLDRYQKIQDKIEWKIERKQKYGSLSNQACFPRGKPTFRPTSFHPRFSSNPSRPILSNYTHPNLT